MASYKYKKVNGRTLMQVGARWIDVTEFNEKQRDDIYKQSGGGKGSKASQEYADKLRGKKPDTKTKTPGPSNVGNNLGSGNPKVTADYGDENSVVNAQTQANKNAAGDSNESLNPLEQTDINGNKQKWKFDPVTGRSIGTTEAGDLVKALQEGDKEAIARERARLGLPAYGTGDVSADRKRVEDGLIARYDEIYAPQKEKEYQQTRTELINSGFVPGSKAYNDQMFELDRRYNDARSQYASQALDRGLAEYKGLTDVDISQRTQSSNEATAAGQQLKNLMPDFQPYKGSNVEAANITGVYGVKEGGTVSSANNKASIDAAEKARKEAAALENAQRQGQNQGDPGAGQRAGEGLGGLASNSSAVANLGTQVNLPGSTVSQSPTQSATTPALGTQGTLPGAALKTIPAATTDQNGNVVFSAANYAGPNPYGTNNIQEIIAKRQAMGVPDVGTPGPNDTVQSASEYNPNTVQTANSNNQATGTMSISSPAPQIKPSTPSIGTTSKANVKPVATPPKNTVYVQPKKSTIKVKAKYNPFGNKTGFLIGKNKAL